MLSLILAIIGILLFFVSDILGLIITIIAFVLAKSGMKKNEKYTKEAYNISKVAIIIQTILIIVLFIYSLVTVSNIIEDANGKIDEINNNYQVTE